MHRRDGSTLNVEIVDYPFKAAIMKKLELVTPGEILLEEWLKPMGLSQYRFALEIGVSPRRINEIVHGKRAITAGAKTVGGGETPRSSKGMPRGEWFACHSTTDENGMWQIDAALPTPCRGSQVSDASHLRQFASFRSHHARHRIA